MDDDLHQVWGFVNMGADTRGELPEFEQTLDISADRIARICDVVSAVALVCIAVALWRRR